jgi:hypothetical protein
VLGRVHDKAASERANIGRQSRERMIAKRRKCGTSFFPMTQRIEIEQQMMTCRRVKVVGHKAATLLSRAAYDVDQSRAAPARA